MSAQKFSKCHSLLCVCKGKKTGATQVGFFSTKDSISPMRSPMRSWRKKKPAIMLGNKKSKEARGENQEKALGMKVDEAVAVSDARLKEDPLYTYLMRRTERFKHDDFMGSHVIRNYTYRDQHSQRDLEGLSSNIEGTNRSLLSCNASIKPVVDPDLIVPCNASMKPLVEPSLSDNLYGIPTAIKDIYFAFPFCNIHLRGGHKPVKKNNKSKTTNPKISDSKLLELESMKKTKNSKSRKTETMTMKQNNKSKLKISLALKDLGLQKFIDKSSVEVSCFSSNEDLAFRNMKFDSKNKMPSKDISIFNTLILSFAKKGKIQNVQKLFLMLHQNQIQPVLQTYAGALQCVARMKGGLDTKLAQGLVDRVHKQGLDLKEIANACYFDRDDWEYTLKAIQSVIPDFKLNPPAVVGDYTQRLLSPLNIESERLESNPYAADANFLLTHEDMMKKVKVQMNMEKSFKVSIPSIHKIDPRRLYRKTIRKKLKNKLLAEWKVTLTDSTRRLIKYMHKSAKENIDDTLYPYMKLFTPEVYTDIVMDAVIEILIMSDHHSPDLLILERQIGHWINKKYSLESRLASGVEEKMTSLYSLYLDQYLDPSPSCKMTNHRQVFQWCMNQQPDTINFVRPANDLMIISWPTFIKEGIGKVLFGMIITDLKVNVNIMAKGLPELMVPAFSTFSELNSGVSSSRYVKPHPVLHKLWRDDLSQEFKMATSLLPMMVPPVPWINKNLGAMALSTVNLVRKKKDQHMIASKTKDTSQYPGVLDSLNTLSATAWKVNNPILDLQIELFNSGGAPKINIPPASEPLGPLPVLPKLTSEEKYQLYRDRVETKKAKWEAHGLWCQMLYRLSIGNMYRHDVFWFPHNLDFRGRTYPLPPHLNHLNDDTARAILLFAKGRPLGDRGLDWLKIHLVNLTGLKKRFSNQERLDFANDNLEAIYDSALNPMDGEKWWQDSDEPWQTLACCKEICSVGGWVYAGKQARDYVCYFPVHQDGSCNGLQHYAALGRDQKGAESVNLIPHDRPQDVYSNILELVEAERRADMAAGDEVAVMLEGQVKRKTIKQTIMTTVYGVTMYGAKYQILKQLKAQEFDEEQAWKASVYLTKLTFKCLRSQFQSAKDIQDWFTSIARLMSLYSQVEWVTPLGFPVVQPYFRKISKVEGEPTIFKPNGVKQKNSFPPNYVHSLDSTHMMLTSLYCMKRGINYVSVHDCFWTHPCHVDIMNSVTREQFVNMHKEPLLENLSQHLRDVKGELHKTLSQGVPDSNPNLEHFLNKAEAMGISELLEQVPPRGDADLNEVLDSTYFFS